MGNKTKSMPQWRKMTLLAILLLLTPYIYLSIPIEMMKLLTGGCIFISFGGLICNLMPVFDIMGK